MHVPPIAHLLEVNGLEGLQTFAVYLDDAMETLVGDLAFMSPTDPHFAIKYANGQGRIQSLREMINAINSIKPEETLL